MSDSQNWPQVVLMFSADVLPKMLCQTDEHVQMVNRVSVQLSERFSPVECFTFESRILLRKLLKGYFGRLNPMSKISDVFAMVDLKGLAEHYIFKSIGGLLDRRHSIIHVHTEVIKSLQIFCFQNCSPMDNC